MEAYQYATSLRSRELGEAGESYARAYLEKNSYTILHMNWRCKYGEIDIIACDQLSNEIAIIEVKTRKSALCGRPLEAVTRKKQQQLRRLSALWRQEHQPHLPLRIDVIGVSINSDTSIDITHVKRVFL
ncbi:MAG: YraN family protein [Actinomycetaceae bacterium]|nr:YraN family protein [Actinomycetaceae bacterium]